MMQITDFQKIGVGLTGFGIAFLFLGILFFFDKGLLAIGNDLAVNTIIFGIVTWTKTFDLHFKNFTLVILFICGLAFVIGLERTFRFFFQKHKLKATGFFVGGMFVVLLGWPVIGMCVEIYGFFLLFSGFFPVVINFLRRVPVIGSILMLPGIRTVADKLGESNSMV